MTKRFIDIVVAASVFLVLAPAIIIIAILVRIWLGAPVLFSQDRPGLGGTIFRLHKFRTMTDDRDGSGVLLPDVQRMTGFGQLLRKTSLDELPSLWNVLRGDMSLVGPRPLLVEYLKHYTPQQMRRHEVRPGVTGWAQVSGRNAISWEHKFKLDIWYVDNQSLLLDLKIIVMTFGRVFRAEGVSHPGEATMTYFTGTNRKVKADNRGKAQS